MKRYILQRVLLLPVTLFSIVFVTFIIINLAPGEPVYVSGINQTGALSRKEGAGVSNPEDRYTQFRHFFGLDLPVVFNRWPFVTTKAIIADLQKIQEKNLPQKEYSSLRIYLADMARFSLHNFFLIANDQSLTFETRRLAFSFFIRGATRFSYTGPHLTEIEKKENDDIAEDTLFLDRFREHLAKNPQELDQQIRLVSNWYEEKKKLYDIPRTGFGSWVIMLTETRFFRYMKRTVTLDFGVLRNDPNTTVISEVISRLKYSLTISILPMLATFFFCQIFGLFMAIKAGSIFDRGLNILFLMLWATPIFVIGPFLIEKVALHNTYPFTDHPFPIRGFSSPDSVYKTFTSFERFTDILRHITLPFITVFYSSLAMQTRLSRQVFLECMSKEYVLSAYAKGVRSFSLYTQHIGRNAAIPIVTAIAGSLSVIIGGSVIVETIFDIHGFGKFFYEAILNRDYNVMMFSALIGSFLGLLGYLVADISYMFLDPRVTLAKRV